VVGLLSRRALLLLEGGQKAGSRDVHIVKIITLLSSCCVISFVSLLSIFNTTSLKEREREYKNVALSILRFVVVVVVFKSL